MEIVKAYIKRDVNKTLLIRFDDFLYSIKDLKSFSRSTYSYELNFIFKKIRIFLYCNFLDQVNNFTVDDVLKKIEFDDDFILHFSKYKSVLLWLMDSGTIEEILQYQIKIHLLKVYINYPESKTFSQLLRYDLDDYSKQSLNIEDTQIISLSERYKETLINNLYTLYGNVKK